MFLANFGVHIIIFFSRRTPYYNLFFFGGVHVLIFGGVMFLFWQGVWQVSGGQWCLRSACAHGEQVLRQARVVPIYVANSFLFAQGMYLMCVWWGEWCFFVNVVCANLVNKC